MPDIHYTDAILTVLFTGGIAFMLWSVRQFTNIKLAIANHARKSNKHVTKLERKLRKQIQDANENGAKVVLAQFNELMKGINHG